MAAIKRLTTALCILAILFLTIPFAQAATAGPGLSSWSQDGKDMLPLLPANHIARADISSLPLEPRSSTWINAIATHGGGTGYLKAYMPMYIQYVGPGVPMQKFLFDRESSRRPSDHVPFALPAGYMPELSSTDSKMSTINRDTRVAYEMSYVDDCMPGGSCSHPMGRYPNGSYVAGGGIVYALSNLSIHTPPGTSGVVVSGMQQIPLELSRADIASGSLDHAVAISFFAPGNTNSAKDYLWPASATSYSASYPANFPKHGARVRLKAGYDISGFSPNNQILLKGLKTYGGFFTITSGTDGMRIWGEKGALSSADNNELISAGNAILRQFEFVDERSLMVSLTSYEAKNKNLPQVQSAGGVITPVPTPASTSLPTPTPTATITVTSPDGGESWLRGTTRTITWSYTGSPGSTVRIVLTKAGTEVGTITSSTSIGSSGRGSYSWPISSEGLTGSDFLVSVRSTSQSTIRDLSNNYFTLRS
jgi:hypothetical protein